MTFSLSARVRPKGGPVRLRLQETATPPIQGRGRIVVMVHGYNTDEAGATKNYQELPDGLRSAYSDGGPLVPETMGGLFWPGDANWWIFSALSYPQEMGQAKDTAARLAEFLRTLQGPSGGSMRVDFFGHSLGCRVVLETLRAARPYFADLRVYFGNICLAAAAVPLPMLEPGRRLNSIMAVSQRLVVLHSHGDRTLHWAFPPGETAAGEGFFPHALGRDGAPPWVQAENHRLDDLDHGDYWTAANSLYFAADSFRLGAMPRLLFPYAVGAHAVDSHALPPPHEIGP